MPIRPPAADSRNLVTVLAWCFIALSAFGVFMGIVQGLLLQTIFQDPKFTAALSNARVPPGFSSLFGVILQHLQLFVWIFLVGSAVTLVASIGLLKRRNWARILFIGLLALGIVWTLGGTVLQFVIAPQLAPPPEAMRVMPEFKFMFGVAILFNVIWNVALSCLLGWLIKRLVSPDIVAEFRR